MYIQIWYLISDEYVVSELSCAIKHTKDSQNVAKKKEFKSPINNCKC